MEILNYILVTALVTIGVVSGSFLCFICYLYFKMYRAKRTADELSKNRLNSYIHGSLNFNRQ